MPNADAKNTLSRRVFLIESARMGGVALVFGALGALANRGTSQESVWQIDPQKCTQCGLCATTCVLTPSAVKCCHAYAMCGYCKLCFGLFRDQRTGDTLSAENNRCPTDAISRNYIEAPYHEIAIDESLCIGCAKCVDGCQQFGNGSMFLQIRHDRCANCNQCAIASACPAGAIARVPPNKPYLLKGADYPEGRPDDEKAEAQ
jgi:Na+-translocating ferredoxin:NAD+ oxidoreductase subunit B